MKIESLTFEQLLKAKQTASPLSYNGFIINVTRSLMDGKITEQEKDILINNK